MVCTSPSLTLESYEDIAIGTTSGADTNKPAYNRRHSSAHPRRQSSSSVSMDNEEGLLLKARLATLKIKC